MKRVTSKYKHHYFLALIFSILTLSCASSKQNCDSVPELIETAKMVIGTTINANNFFRNDYDQDALDFIMLEKMDYLMIDPNIKEIFTFKLIIEDGKLSEIVATTTNESSVGDGKMVIYNVTTKVWSGDLVESCKTRE
ncbi:MAG: hypothetical protein HN356_15825 [Calditrichaeota bacterium]|jgi:hypothetical protein|nr:hypothetical protein [Calditrichota bacterium]MBT7619181.1 hypothetical protein [Calditrichota bacterium]MBT7790147.1 hypothetical protein [Calditrichota bacterium]